MRDLMCDFHQLLCFNL